LGLATLKGALSVSVHVYPPDRRKRDLDNCIKPILDALQHHRVILDDYQVGHLSLMRHDPEPGRARAEVSLLEVEVEVET
jgi:crossover junction endodeoxyribonuclease RusA